MKNLFFWNWHCEQPAGKVSGWHGLLPHLDVFQVLLDPFALHFAATPLLGRAPTQVLQGVG